MGNTGLSRDKARGVLYGVGVGPGDPGLLTLAGMRILQEVDVICAPVSKPDGESSALKVIEKNSLVKGKKIIKLVFPMVKDERTLRESRREACMRVLKELEKGRKVAFVTIGDPSLYSTFSYIVEGLKERAVVRTVPGVTSVSACLSACNISLAKGDERVAILPLKEAEDRLENLLKNFDSVVLLKAKKAMRVVKELERLGALERALVFARCGDADFKVFPLSDYERREGEYFSMILIRGLRLK